MNRKQRKAKRLRATRHTKSQAHAWKKYDTPCSDIEEAAIEMQNHNRQERIQHLLDENKKLSELAQKKQRNVGRGVSVICTIALVVWLVILWIK